MAGMYKDAKDWLREGVTEGFISTEQIVDFALCNADNDDIERWFNISMDDPDTNPGADKGECSKCDSEADLEYLEAHDGLCETCVGDQEEEAKEWSKRATIGLIYSIYRIYMEQPYHLTYEDLQEMVESLEDDLVEP